MTVKEAAEVIKNELRDLGMDYWLKNPPKTDEEKEMKEYNEKLVEAFNIAVNILLHYKSSTWKGYCPSCGVFVKYKEEMDKGKTDLVNSLQSGLQGRIRSSDLNDR